MGVRAAEHPRVCHPRQLDVAGIARRAGDPLHGIDPGATPAEHAHRRPIRRPFRWAIENRGYVAVVVRAAADVARHALPDVILGGIRGSRDDRLGRHQLSRRAESALRAIAGDERLLKRIQPAVFSEPFDRRHGAGVGPDGELTARVDRDAVEMHGARAALAAIAPNLGPRQVEVVADQLGKRPAVLDLDGALHTVDGQGDGGARRRIGRATLGAERSAGGRKRRRRGDGCARLEKRPPRDRTHSRIIVDRHGNTRNPIGHRLGVMTRRCSSMRATRARAPGAFPISRSRAHTHRRHGHPLQTVPSAGLIERPQEKNRVDALR